MIEKKPTKSPPKTRVPRPDELTPDTFEFISAIDEYRRAHMVSIVTLEHVIDVLDTLGYLKSPAGSSELRELERAVDDYKLDNARLFPNWSEIFKIALELGYTKP